MTNLVFIGAMVLTAYCNEGPKGCKTCCGKWAPYNRTASKTAPIENFTIGASKQFPLGSWLYIESIGWRKVEDRPKKGLNIVDVYMRRHKQAKEFGRQQRNVWLLK